MDTLLPLFLASIKTLVLLSIAGAMAVLLRGRPARLRAVVWGVALSGSLLIPAIAPFLPSWSFPLPRGIADITATQNTSLFENPELMTISALETERQFNHYRPTTNDTSHNLSQVHWSTWLLSIWAIGAIVAITRLVTGLFRITYSIRRAQPVCDPQWHDDFDLARERIGCRRKVKILECADVEIPATVGILRPVILVPAQAHTWLRDRRQAVLLHELVHIVRFDWAVRITARLARSVYWFNPLTWWAVSRLEFEQELACDEEVLALGTRASNYACHLLGIARSIVHNPAPAIPGLEMARMTHLEERIMSISKKTTRRRVGLTVLLPASIVLAAMVPALAAVYPEDPGPRPASNELRQIMNEMKEAEERMEPHLAKIEELNLEMKPHIEMIEDIEIDIDNEALAEIELRMKPYLEQMEAIELKMEPLTNQVARFEDHLENLMIHIEDGTLAEVQRQIEEQVALHMEGLENLHLDMAPFIEEIEAIHKEMEPLHEEMENLHRQMEPHHAEFGKLQEALEPFHEQMEAFHEQMEPFHEEMERLGDRLQIALKSEVAAVIQDFLGPAVSPGAPINEAAARIIDEADIHVEDDFVRIRASKRETREILTDLLTAHRIGTKDAFNAAIDKTADALSPLEIQTN